MNGKLAKIVRPFDYDEHFEEKYQWLVKAYFIGLMISQMPVEAFLDKSMALQCIEQQWNSTTPKIWFRRKFKGSIYIKPSFERIIYDEKWPYS